jgi:hypothetical protein
MLVCPFFKLPVLGFPFRLAFCVRCKMPVFRYFIFVGGALIALLFAINAYVPQAPEPMQANAPGFDHSQIRITSNRVADKPIIFDTSQPTIVPPPQLAQAIPVRAADTKSADTKIAETAEAMAQMDSTPKHTVTKPKPKPRKFARRDYPNRQYQYPNRQTAWAQPMFPSLFGSW